MKKKWSITRKVLQCCHDNGIRPVVTMMHFSSPKWLISMGGWENPEVVDLFAAFCRRLVTELAVRWSMYVPSTRQICVSSSLL